MQRALRSSKTAVGRLRDFRFHRYDRCAGVVRRLYALRKRIESHALAAEIWRLYEWLLTPLTMQAIDYPGIAEHLATCLEARREFDSDFILLMVLIEEPPTDRSVRLMMEAEYAVAKGNYDGISKEPQRFAELEVAMKADTSLRNFWNRYKSRYDGALKANARGVIRRTLARERGFDSRVDFNWKRKADRAQITFDALCYRWCLYGFEKDLPLLLKLTANPTPHGTMIFVPRRMSLAGHRSFVWRAVNRLHQAHTPARQGIKFSVWRIQNTHAVQAAKILDLEARKRGLRGEERFEYICERMSPRPSGSRAVKRLLYDA